MSLRHIYYIMFYTFAQELIIEYVSEFQNWGLVLKIIIIDDIKSIIKLKTHLLNFSKIKQT